MRKLRTVSLEGLDTLSHQEKARLYGGAGNDSIPPTPTPKITFSLPPVTSPPPVTVSVSPGSVGVTVKF